MILNFTEDITNRPLKYITFLLLSTYIVQLQVAEILLNLYELFQSKDATMVEINPFAEDSHGDCKYPNSIVI